jgi:hypothetical protein
VAGYAGGQHTAAWTTLADAILADTADCVHPSGRWQRAPDDPRVDAALPQAFVHALMMEASVRLTIPWTGGGPGCATAGSAGSRLLRRGS